MRLSITHKKRVQGRERENGGIRRRKGMGGEREGGEKENVKSVKKGGQSMRSNNMCGLPVCVVRAFTCKPTHIYLLCAPCTTLVARA